VPHRSQEIHEQFPGVSGFCHNVDEIRALLECYAASSGNPLPAFQDNISVPFLTVKESNEAGLVSHP
jgi:hypothetical protein